jgi:hypothetical protein
MNFDIRQLDKLTFDDAEPLLGDYIDDAISRFLESDLGQTYAITPPQRGGWIETFIEMAYLYGEMTLSKMTKTDVRQVMESILPRKLTLLEPTEADDAIPELIAFWTFLQQKYKLRNAGAISGQGCITWPSWSCLACSSLPLANPQRARAGGSELLSLCHGAMP